jgi:REP element-mobilizing transposase RayT
MVHAYHVIMPVYGFWLPNDPRGSWSDMVRKWELIHFGPSTKASERRTLDELTPVEIAQREEARRSLTYPPVTLTDAQVNAVADGFASQVSTSGYTVGACSILPEHTHLVIARHTYKVEQVVILLKGAATRRCIECSCHPLAEYAEPGERPPRMWAEHEWKVYLDSEEAIDEAIHYVEQNPLKESRPAQSWPWVRPFEGLPKGWVTYR